MYINIPFKYIPAGINPERHGAVGKAHCFFLRRYVIGRDLQATRLRIKILGEVCI